MKKKKIERYAFVFACLLRLGFILYGYWQDEHMLVKYTDIDYAVYTDASREISLGNSPFQRTTYRYTPLLAFLLLPNIYIHETFGKFIFVLCDLLIGYLLCKILILRGLDMKDAIKYACIWLFHPFSFTISTRGNADSIIGFLVLLSIYLLSKKRLISSAIVYGLAVHFKIYPIVYALAFLVFLDDNYDPRYSILKTNSFLSFKYLFSLLNYNRIVFSLISGSVFFVLNGLFYYMYGYEFLYETYLYHFTRTDNRHNFSVYFYDLYLKYNTPSGLMSGLIAFVPQILSLIVISLKTAQDLPFAIFLLTMIFVTFNKVCTAQYFVWYTSLIPLILPETNLKLCWDYIAMTAVWLFGELNWLYWAYNLEMKGINTFFQLWIAGLFFFCANVWIICIFLRNHSMNNYFVKGYLQKIK